MTNTLSDNLFISTSPLHESRKHDFSLVATLVTEQEAEFFKTAWVGARFVYVTSNSIICAYLGSTAITRPEDFQNIAKVYRELCADFQTDVAACIINVNAIPKMPGYLGYVFGFQGLFSILQCGHISEFRQIFYDDSNGGAPILAPEISSAMNLAWDDKLGEPIDTYMTRLFIPIRV